MAWNGFLSESKSYMNYPQCGKVLFWKQFPSAWWKYHRCIWKSNNSDRSDWRHLFKHRSKMCDNNRG